MSLRTFLTAVVLLLAAGGVGCSSGSRCSVRDNADGTATLTCDDGTSFIVRSSNGVDGIDGVDGTDGTSCTVTDLGMGTRQIRCADGTMVTLTDGTIGTDGRNAWLTGPGFDVEVRSVSIGADLHPTAELRFTDAAGRPLDRTGALTEGAITASFAVAHLPTEVRVDGDAILPYQSYLTTTATSADGLRTATQPASDSAGTWTVVDADDGVYRYTFAATLPTDYPVAETHRVALWATRTFDGVRYVANASPTFRPDGMPVTETRDIVTTQACSTCHTPLSAHGGTREDIGTCLTCHGRGFADPDTGNTLELRAMIHRIHRGEHLPSVENGEPYEIIGFGGRTHDYTHVVFPQDIRNCTTCHAGTDADLPLMQPSRAACGSCHDDIWFEAGAPPEPWMSLHPGGDRPTDDRCTVCHQASGGLSPILDNHFTRIELPLAQEPSLTVDAVVLDATRHIQLDFTVLVNGTPRNILTAPLTSLSAVVAGPTTDYLFNASFTLTSASAGALTARDAAMGQFRWVSAATVDTIAATASADPLRSVPGVPITTTGTWAIGMQATLRVADAPTTTSCVTASTCTSALGAIESGSWGCIASFCTPQFTYPAWNTVAYFALTDEAPVPRREVVTHCNDCHQRLELHGGGRNDPEYCVMCHNSTFDTADRMPIPAGGSAQTQSLSLAHFVHRLHTGADGVTDATYWGPAPNPRPTPGTGGTPVDFGTLRFPADRRACDTCHGPELTLEPMESLRPVRTRELTDTRVTLSTTWQGATASACTGCHDGPATYAHADSMTTLMGVESCSTCHERGSAFGIDVVHARPEYDLR